MMLNKPDGWGDEEPADDGTVSRMDTPDELAAIAIQRGQLQAV